SEDPKEHARSPSDEAENDGFCQELELNGSFRCSHRDSNSDLPRALGYGNQHHVHNPNSPHDQGNGGDGDQQNRQSLTGIELRLNNVLGVTNVEIILFFGTKMMAVTEYSGCFLSRHLDHIL